MYTKGYVNQEMIVSQRAYPVREATDGTCFEEASLNPTASSATTYKNGIMARNQNFQRPLGLSWISPGSPRATMMAEARPNVQLWKPFPSVA